MNAPALSQPELLPRRRTGAEREADVRALEALLRGRGWMKCREILERRPDWAGGAGAGGEGRYVRWLAARSGQIISGPGTPGYILADESTVANPEVDAALDEAANRLIAQMRSEARQVRHFRTLSGLRRAHRDRLQQQPS